MRTLRHRLFIGFWSIGTMVNAQYGQGIAGTSWEGVWGVGAQPACLTLNDDRAEINILRVGLDLDNTLLYLGKENFGLFGFSGRIQVDTSEVDLARLAGTDHRGVSQDLRIMGPSFSLRLDHRSKLAFTNSIRSAFSALDLDALARKLGIDTITLSPGGMRRVEEGAIQASAISWSEHGLTYGRMFDLGNGHRLHAGVTGKYLFGLVAIYLENSPPLLTAVNDSVETLTEVNMRYGRVHVPEDPGATGIGGWVHGSGFAMDAGVIYELLRTTDGAADMGRDHALRVGVAITDLGGIRFNKQADRYAISNGRTTVDELDDLEVDHVNAIDSALSDLLLGSPTASYIGPGFTQRLPAAFHASAEFSPVTRIALRSELVLALTTPTDGPAPRKQLNFTPRFETRMFCVGVPVSVDWFGNWSFGMMLRAGGFMIGSDRLGGLFGLTDVRGADVYFGAKVRIKGVARTSTD